VLPRADAQRVLDACVADGSLLRSGQPALRVRDGGAASIATTKDRAFVSGFDIARAGDGIFGDPRVETTQEGTSLAVRARLDAGQDADARKVVLDVMLEQTELVQPIQEALVRVPGASVDVVVQTPLALRQTLAASAELADDEVLVLGGIPGHDGEHDLFVVVDPRAESSGAVAVGIK
jgi:hypothetical protein